MDEYLKYTIALFSQQIDGMLKEHDEKPKVVPRFGLLNEYYCSL